VLQNNYTVYILYSYVYICSYPRFRCVYWFSLIFRNQNRLQKLGICNVTIIKRFIVYVFQSCVFKIHTHLSILSRCKINSLCLYVPSVMMFCACVTSHDSHCLMLSCVFSCFVIDKSVVNKSSTSSRLTKRGSNLLVLIPLAL
jgi:hypothetical protein